MVKKKTRPTETKSESNETKLQEKQIRPFVFISHDTRDAKIAESFSKLLSNVSAGVLKSFRSSDNKGTQGIEYGLEWYPEIIGKLNDSTDVVCILTQNSLNRPWILFEAGLAKGKLDRTILGLTVGISLSEVNSGPFAQFQNCAGDEDAVTKLVTQLVKKIPNSEPVEAIIREQVKLFLTESLAHFPKPSSPSDKKEPVAEKTSNDTTVKLFEEVKIMFQDLPRRIESHTRNGRDHKFRRYRGGMMEEIFFMSNKVDPLLGILTLFAPLKDALPWVYDYCIETIREIRTTKSKEQVRKKIRDFTRTVEFIVHGPLLQELEMNENYFHEYRHILRDMEKHINDFINHLEFQSSEK